MCSKIKRLSQLFLLLGVVLDKGDKKISLYLIVLFISENLYQSWIEPRLESIAVIRFYKHESF